jgi:hypothetical protein
VHKGFNTHAHIDLVLHPHPSSQGTGCIFHYDDVFPQGSGKGFKESDKPNFTGSYYSYVKVGPRPQSAIVDRRLRLVARGGRATACVSVDTTGCR